MSTHAEDARRRNSQPCDVVDTFCLAPLDRSHATSLHAAVIASIEHLRPWLPWARTTPTLGRTMAFCDAAIADRACGRCETLVLTLRESARVIGVVSLARLAGADFDVTEVGYWLHVAFQGDGHMTRAVDLALRARPAPRRPSFDVLTASPDNTRSRRVALRCGFRPAGTFFIPTIASHPTARAAKRLYIRRPSGGWPCDAIRDALKLACQRHATARHSSIEAPN